LDEVRASPATVSVEFAALAVGISRAYAYRLLQRGQFPVRTRLVGSRRVVVTAALVAYLDGPTPPVARATQAPPVAGR
jgi:predicted DNA-binding transcriptional regulator AlpA